MWINYQEIIDETEKELSSLERKLRGRRTAVRIRMLRLLKSGRVKSLRACAPLIGYSFRQLTRWWKQYKEGGLELLLEEKPLGRHRRSAA